MVAASGTGVKDDELVQGRDHLEVKELLLLHLAGGRDCFWCGILRGFGGGGVKASVRESIA